MKLPPIITRKEALLILHSGESNLDVSLDLGISKTKISMKNGIAHVGEHKVALGAFEKIKDDACYFIQNNEIRKIYLFSDETNFYYKLFPTSDWPTITLSSTPMHRHTNISPKKDTELKIREISPVTGTILDTCCGLGYTAIMASWKADKIITFERDENVLTVARYNPYSAELFSSKKIEIKKEDVAIGIKKFKANFFDRIIHDPPTIRYSPLLYTIEFYKELYRVLKPSGILYHYAPNPQKTKGQILYPKLIDMLKKCGFRDVEYHEVSSGIRAVK